MNIEMLKKEFENIREHEKRAKSFYDHYIDQLEDGEIKEQLIQIRDDEVMHIEVANKLIEIIS